MCYDSEIVSVVLFLTLAAIFVNIIVQHIIVQLVSFLSYADPFKLLPLLMLVLCMRSFALLDVTDL